MHWSEVEPGARFAVLGEGSDVSLTADALRGALATLDIATPVLEIKTAVEDFPRCIEHLTASGLEGVSICNPFKSEAAQLAKQFYIVKHGLGVANALKLGPEIYAQNTEVPAFTSKIHDLKPGLALVMGSGRAARSAVLSLFELGWRVRVWNRNVIRTRPFVTVFETYGKVEMASSPDPVGCNLIVNATPIGTKAGEIIPIKWTYAAPRTTVVDFVYRGVATELLRSASQRGFRCVDGRELLVEQAAFALEWWLGRPVPREPMCAAIGFHKLPERPKGA